MKTQAILRREWFGGLLVQAGAGYPAILDHAGYVRTREELAARAATGANMRLVDAEELGFPIRSNALSTPGAAYLDITNRCDGACTHCYSNATPSPAPDELRFAQWAHVISRLADGGAYYVRLTGGKPTLREDLPDLLGLLAEKGIASALNTHGRFRERVLFRLLECGVRDIRLSVDGTESVHDAIRGPGAYREVVTTLRRIAEYNCSASEPADPTMNVVLMKSTRHCIAPLTALAAELGCKISFGLLRPAGRASRDLMLSPEEVAQAAREVEARRRELGLRKGRARVNFDIFCETGGPPPSPRPFPFDNSKCPIGTIGVGIAANGRLMPCNYMGHMEGSHWLGESVLEHDVLDLWQTSRVLQEPRHVRRNSCADCVHYRMQCNGGCPATAYALTGDADGRDPYCVRGVALRPDSMPHSIAGGTAASSLLRGIQKLGVYTDAEWTEYCQTFVSSGSEDPQMPSAAAHGDCDLAGRIERSEGARPVEPDFSASPKILRAGGLARLKAQRGLRLGVVSGAYDLLHLGHVRNMRFARERMGSNPRAVLCALTLCDEAIRQKKGPDRPVLKLNERLALLAAVRSIDFVVPLEQPDCLRALELLEPEFLFKSPADLWQPSVRQEIDLVARGGGGVSFLPTYRHGALSTTCLLEQRQAGSPREGMEAPRAFSPSDSLCRLLRCMPSRNDALNFLEALYEAALEEVGLPCPPAWPRVKRAFLVTFDGPSGVGKDTQLRLLWRYLRQEGAPRHPLSRADLKHLDPFRRLLKHLWDTPEFSGQRELAFGLLICGRRYALDAPVGQWLSDPKTIILQNRSFLSQVAYHASSPTQMDQWLACCQFDPRADLPMLLDFDAAVAFERVKHRSVEKGHRIYANEQPGFIARVQRNFAHLENRMTGLARIDTAVESESVAAGIARIVLQRLAQEGF